MRGALTVLWEWWKHVAQRIGNVQARGLLTLFYFVIVAPFALVVRYGSDPLAMKPGAPVGWRPKPTGECTSIDYARQQF